MRQISVKNLKSNNGSVLFIVLVVMTVLICLASGIYYTVNGVKQSIELDHENSQAYQTGISVANLLESSLRNGDASYTNLITKFNAMSQNSMIYLNKVSSNDSAAIQGMCDSYDIYISRKSDTPVMNAGIAVDAMNYVIGVDVEYQGETQHVEKVFQLIPAVSYIRSNGPSFDKTFAATGYGTNDSYFATKIVNSPLYFDQEYTVMDKVENMEVTADISAAGTLTVRYLAVPDSLDHKIYLTTGNDFITESNESKLGFKGGKIRVGGNFYFNNGSKIGLNNSNQTHVYVLNDMYLNGNKKDIYGDVFINGDLYANSSITINGNLYVNGTIYCQTLKKGGANQSSGFTSMGSQTVEVTGNVKSGTDSWTSSTANGDETDSEVGGVILKGPDATKHMIEDKLTQVEYTEWQIPVTEVAKNRYDIDWGNNKIYKAPLKSGVTATKDTQLDPANYEAAAEVPELMTISESGTIANIYGVRDSMKQAFIIDTGDQQYKLKADGTQELDSDGNPIPIVLYINLLPNYTDKKITGTNNINPAGTLNCCSFRGRAAYTGNNKQAEQAGNGEGYTYVIVRGNGAVVFTVDNKTYTLGAEATKFTWGDGVCVMTEGYYQKLMNKAVDLNDLKRYHEVGTNDVKTALEATLFPSDKIKVDSLTGLPETDPVTGAVIYEHKKFQIIPTLTSPTGDPYNANIFFVSNEKNAELSFSGRHAFFTGFLYSPYMTYTDSNTSDTDIRMFGGMIIADYMIADQRYYVCCVPDEAYLKCLMGKGKTLLSISSRTWRKVGANLN